MGEVAEARLYARVDEQAGVLSGRMRRRRDAEHELWELPDGRVIRWLETRRGAVLDHQRDASGRPLVTVSYEHDVPVRAVAHGATDQTVELAGFTKGPIAGAAAMWAPPPGTPLAGGTLEVRTLATDPFARAFVDGLLAGCGCDLFDRSTVWIDGRTAAHHALLVPDPAALPGEGVPDLVEIWAVPREGTTLLLVWRARAPADPVAASVLARVVPALVDLDAPATAPDAAEPR